VVRAVRTSAAARPVEVVLSDIEVDRDARWPGAPGVDVVDWRVVEGLANLHQRLEAGPVRVRGPGRATVRQRRERSRGVLIHVDEPVHLHVPDLDEEVLAIRVGAIAPSSGNCLPRGSVVSAEGVVAVSQPSSKPSPSVSWTAVLNTIAAGVTQSRPFGPAHIGRDGRAHEHLGRIPCRRTPRLFGRG
jgi:hypothetical protein